MQAKFTWSRGRIAIALVGVLAAACATSGVAQAKIHTSKKPAPAVFLLPSPGNDGVLAYAQKTGILAKALAKVNATVQWGGTYSASSETVSAFNAGSLNEIGGGNSVIVGAAATSGLQATVVMDQVFVPNNAAIIVTPNSGITSIKGLIGQTVGVNQNGHGEYELLLALKDAGIPFSDVHMEFLTEAEEAAAFATGSLKAWVPFSSLLTQALEEGAHVLKWEGSLKGDDDETPYAFATSFVKAHPAAIATFVNVVTALNNQMRKNPKPFENVFETTGPTALSDAILQRQYDVDRASPPFHYPNAKDRAEFQNIANFFYDNGLTTVDVKTSNYIASAKEVALLQSEKTSYPTAPTEP